MYTRQHLNRKKVKLFSGPKVTPNSHHPTGTACIVLHLVALNAADIWLAYLIGVVTFLRGLRVNSQKMPVWRNW